MPMFSVEGVSNSDIPLIVYGYTSASVRTMASVAAAFTNNHGQTLNLYATQNWIGNFVEDPAKSVNAGATTQFGHQGSKGAVIYGESEDATDPVGYLLAWASIDGTLQVYVDCGPLSQVYYNGWQTAAVANLNNSSAASSDKDESTSSSASAVIQDESGQFTLAVVGANVS